MWRYCVCETKIMTSRINPNHWKYPIASTPLDDRRWQINGNTHLNRLHCKHTHCFGVLPVLLMMKQQRHWPTIPNWSFHSFRLGLNHSTYTLCHNNRNRQWINLSCISYWVKSHETRLTHFHMNVLLFIYQGHTNACLITCRWHLAYTIFRPSN